MRQMSERKFRTMELVLSTMENDDYRRDQPLNYYIYMLYVQLRKGYEK